MADRVSIARRARGTDWIIARIDTTTGAETYYMAGAWVKADRFGKRIRGYGNALDEKDKIQQEPGFSYEIRPAG